jgi:lipopolysaccharide export system protein LptA
VRPSRPDSDQVQITSVGSQISVKGLITSEEISQEHERKGTEARGKQAQYHRIHDITHLQNK